MYPKKLYLEVSTRCNMHCGMCVKRVPGSSISDKDFPFELFAKLTSCLKTAEALVLNGIGEPLLHPDLTAMVAQAGKIMPAGSWIGFQSNGRLLDADNTARLLDAGLGRLCISVDTLPDDSGACGRFVHQHHRQESPLELVHGVRTRLGAEHFRLGAEIVLLKDTLAKLPALIDRLAAGGVDFILCTHLLAYDQAAQAENLFCTNTRKARELYRKWQQVAERDGLRLADLTAKTWIAPRQEEEHRLSDIYRQMMREAQTQGIWFDISRLEQWDEATTEQAEEAFRLATETAARAGIDISLPPLIATDHRTCHFIEGQAVFVDVDGEVMPCHSLWHNHTIHMDGEAKHIRQQSFGSLRQQDLLQIWQSGAYREFRKSAGAYDFPFCHSCSLGPCPDITGESTPFGHDCFGIAVPCGHCLWCYDAIRCL